MNARKLVFNALIENPNGVEISIFNGKLDPIVLAESLKAMEALEMVNIDWRTGKIIPIDSDKLRLFAFKNRKSLFEIVMSVPKNLKTTRKRINEPYVPKKGRDS